MAAGSLGASGIWMAIDIMVIGGDCVATGAVEVGSSPSASGTVLAGGFWLAAGSLGASGVWILAGMMAAGGDWGAVGTVGAESSASASGIVLAGGFW